MTFPEMLQHFRDRSGLSKTDLANKIDVSPGYIMNIESGHKKPPTQEVCEQIAAALNLEKEEANRLLLTAIEGRLKHDDVAVLRKSYSHTPKTHITPIPTLDMARRIPILPRWEDANKHITDEDIPVGLECVTASLPGKDNTFALRIEDECMSPEFDLGDIIIVDEIKHPKDGDFVLAVDHKGKVPIMRQYKDYEKIKVLHPLQPDCKDIILDARYSITGKVIERVTRAKTY